MAKRVAKPALSPGGQQSLDQYASALHAEMDLRPATVRNYVGDLQQFAAWCEQTWSDGQETEQSCVAGSVATATLVRYRAYLQETCRLRPASVNRTLISLKRYFAWTVAQGLLPHSPAQVVKL